MEAKHKEAKQDFVVYESMRTKKNGRRIGWDPESMKIGGNNFGALGTYFWKGCDLLISGRAMMNSSIQSLSSGVESAISGEKSFFKNRLVFFDILGY